MPPIRGVVLVMHLNHIIDAHPIMIISQTPSSHLADARLQATVNALVIIRSATPHYVCVSRESQTSVSSLFSFSAFTSAFAFCRYGCHISHMSSQPYSHTEITVTVTKPNNEAQSVVHPASIPYSLPLPYCSPINRLLSAVSLLVQ